MARKKPGFDIKKEVRKLARERVGRPPTEKVVPNKKKDEEKHKPTLGKLLGESE